jgi:uncharacterized protein with HEPN domain
VKDDRIYIDHILECIEWITRYTAEGKDAFSLIEKDTKRNAPRAPNTCRIDPAVI